MRSAFKMVSDSDPSQDQQLLKSSLIDLIKSPNFVIHRVDITSFVTETTFNILAKEYDFKCQTKVQRQDATDIWRENLKAWNLKQREENPTALEIALNNLPYVDEKGEIKRREFFTDDLQNVGSHYKGEF